MVLSSLLTSLPLIVVTDLIFGLNSARAWLSDRFLRQTGALKLKAAGATVADNANSKPPIIKPPLRVLRGLSAV